MFDRFGVGAESDNSEEEDGERRREVVLCNYSCLKKCIIKLVHNRYYRISIQTKILLINKHRKILTLVEVSDVFGVFLGLVILEINIRVNLSETLNKFKRNKRERERERGRKRDREKKIKKQAKKGEIGSVCVTAVTSV